MKIIRNNISRILTGFFSLLIFETFSVHAAEDASKVLLTSYDNVRSALAADDLNATKKTAQDLEKKALEIKNETIANHAKEISQSDSLDKAREHFKTISTEAIKLVSGKSEYVIMTCPMANADWIQTNKKVENPYMGKKMLGCGMPKPGSQSAKSSSDAASISMPCCK